MSLCPGYRKCAQNFMCPGSGNVLKFCPIYTAPGYKYQGNVHAMNKKCELSCTLHGI